jgi:FlaA1/EpsC-like NDP-sugar epimerase/lipopolysaccharide/colanic/teichoic acid biosynthesis glycosyltransferase
MSRPKRLFDILTSIIGLALTAPVFLVVGILIKLEDGGPVFFRQERVGYRGRIFRILKFRTMRISEGDGPLVTVGEDPRITRVGGWLRRFKFDELPQLLNVLRGDMSMVGPRPEVPRYVAFYTPEQHRVLEFVPGITDPASIRFWNEAQILAEAPDPERTYIAKILPEKIRLQLEYGFESSVKKDLLVILDTLRHLWPRTRPLLVGKLVRYRRPLIMCTHVLLVAIGYRLAYELRFDFEVAPADLVIFWLTLPLLLAIRLSCYWAYGLFAGYWQHFGLGDLFRLIRAVTMGTLIFAAALAVIGLIPGPTVPRSVLIMDWVGAIFLVGGVRLIARSMREAQVFPQVTGRRTLVIGGGDKAERLLREVRRPAGSGLRVLGLVVDAPRSETYAIHGCAVVGTLDNLPALVQRYRAEFIVIALDTPSSETMERVIAQCQAAEVEFKTLPSLFELLEGTARADQLRNVRIDDLLGREPVKLDLSLVEREIRGRVVAVTGAAGSIGSELVRQVARMRPAKLLLLDWAESPLYFLQLELLTAHPGLSVIPVIRDVTDESAVGTCFAEHRPDYVIHAAAYKHVPMLEENVLEAVRNNVFGTMIMAEAAVQTGSAKFVLISTDKAVNPTSIMGATKRIAERIVLELPVLVDSDTDFRVVRFGNVLGSAGSVVPLFERQLAAGGPLTVTHPEVERYFMTIPEAAQLVLQAASLPEAARRIAMLEMGESVRIVALAEKLIRLAGLEPYRDVQITFTGLRPGEKLQEELTSMLESTVPSGLEKIRLVRPTEPGSGFEARLARLTTALAVGDEHPVVGSIGDLVPEGKFTSATGRGMTARGRARLILERPAHVGSQRERR